MVPTYILGLIARYGPQYGYQIRRRIEEQLADFSSIKLPTIYYHLTKMEEGGLVTAAREKPDARPEKEVYAMTEKGQAALARMLAACTQFEYRPAFSADAAFFFSDQIDPAALRTGLLTHADGMRRAVEAIEAHRRESAQNVPPEHAAFADAIFSHHLKHYRAEWEWAKEALGALYGQEEF